MTSKNAEGPDAPTSGGEAVPGLVPAPRGLTWGPPGQEPFRLGEATVISAAPGTEGVARRLRATVGAATGLPLAEATEGTEAADGTAAPRVELALDAALAPEAYRLAVDAGAVRITGGSAAGLFWGTQTFRQLLGPDAFRRAPSRRGAPGTSPPWSSRTNPASPGAA